MTGHSYTKGNPAQKPLLQQLAVLSYSQFKNILAPADWQTMHHFLHNDKMWTKLVNNSAIFICKTGTEIIGMAYLVPSGHPTHIYPADWSYVRMVGVHPGHRGKGIARRVTQMCVDHARQTHEKIVGLHTSEKMDDARHIYESIGFVQYREIEPIYGMRYWLYRLDLGGDSV